MKKIFSLLGLLMLLFSSGARADSNFVATLDHTASSSRNGTNAITFTVDQEKEHYNNTKAAAWGGWAYAQFSFNIPAGESVKKATLKWTTLVGGKANYNRNNDIYYVKPEITIDYTAASDANVVLTNNATLISSVSIKSLTETETSTDVTDALKDIAKSQSYIIFEWSGNPAGADLYGKGSAKAPVLTIETTEALSEYTINYQLSGSTIKSVSGSDATGNTIEADVVFWENNKKYIAENGATTSITLADGANVLNVPVREANEYTLTVKTSLGTVLSTKTVVEGENADYFVPYYYFNNGKFYTSPTSSAGTISYGQGTINNVTSNIDVILTYTEEANTKVVFYSEAENLAGITEQNDGFTNIRMSNGAAGYFADPTQVTSLQPGVYTLTAATRSGTTKFTVNGSKEILNLTSSGSVVTATSEEFVISKESAIVATAGNASNYFDYVIIRKVADFVATEDLTINDAEICIGQNTQMTATLLPANATNKTLTWTIKESNSIDKGEAEIDAATGEITPLKAGLIAVEVTNGEKTDTKEFTIAAAQFDVTITDAPQEAQVFVGDDASVENKLYVSTKAGYDDMQNTSLLQPVGSVTATKIPTYIYTITVDKKNKTIDVVYEEDIEVTAMNFAQPTQRIANGNSRTMKVVYSPADASFKTAKFTSSNPEVATVDENTGLVTAISEGETTITAEWSENESHGTNISTQMTLTVDKGLVLDRIVYDEMEDATAEVMGYYHPMDGDTLFLPAYIESNGRMIPVSFIKQEAFIGSNLKSIVIPGTVKTIDHRALMYSNTHNAYNEMPEEGLESAFLLEGVEVMRDRIFHGNKYMKKVFLPSTLTDIGYYSFFDTAIEDVYFGGSEEQWNALKNLENAKLPETAKLHFNSNFTAAFINSIEVEEDYAEIAVGEEYEVKASIIPEEIAPVVALTYTSSNEEVATVDEDGVVTGIADGYVTITVSAGEGVEAKVRVKVGDAQQERENVLTMDFEDGEVADYWALAIAESQLVEPTAEGSTGRAAAVVSGSDRGDYVKVNADLEGATKYEVSMDLLLMKSPKTTQFSVLNASSWDTWTTNWGMFWKDTKAQTHNPFLFNLDIAGNSNTANVNIDIDAEGNGVAAQQTWDFENGVWYTLTLAVDVNAHTVDYAIAPKSDLSAVAVSGTYTAPADEMMQIKGIYERNGRYNYSPGAIAIDNVIVDVTERGFVEGQGGNQATGINEAKAEESVKNGKYVENGQIVIYIDGKKFNAAGQQMK